MNADEANIDSMNMNMKKVRHSIQSSINMGSFLAKLYIDSKSLSYVKDVIISEGYTFVCERDNEINAYVMIGWE